MRLKQHRKFHLTPNQTRYPTQHGKGVRDVINSISRGAVRGASWVVKNLDEIITLSKAGYDLYKGERPQGVVDAIKKAKKRVGKEEQQALKKLIGIKTKEVANGVPGAKKELKMLKKIQKQDDIEDKLNLIPQVKNKPQPVAQAKPVDDLLSQIKQGRKLRKTKLENRKPQAPRAGSLEELIKRRREQIQPDLSGGALAQKNLMKIACRQTGGKVSDVLKGVSTAAAGASLLGPEVAVIGIPLSTVSGIASGIAEMFGNGKRRGHMCGKGYEIVNKKNKKDIMNEVKSVLMKNRNNTSIKDLARKVSKRVTGSEPKELVERLSQYIQTKL